MMGTSSTSVALEPEWVGRSEPVQGGQIRRQGAGCVMAGVMSEARIGRNASRAPVQREMIAT
jgi:hypothetical protein